MARRFELPPGASLRVTASSGDVTVIAEERSDILAPEDAQASTGSGSTPPVSGNAPGAPAAALDVRSVSGDLEVVGCSGACRLHTKSGHIEAGDTGPAEADTVSGWIHLRSPAGG